MAISFVNAGTWTAGTTTISPPLPASMQAGDLMLLVVHTANNPITSITGWTQVTNSPVTIGTASTAGGVGLHVWYRWWQSGDGAPTVTPTSGTVTNGRIYGYRGVHQTTPFDATPVSGSKSPASTSVSWPSITTVTANALIFLASALDLDANSTATTSGYTNANLTSITERNDQTVNTATGGGSVVVDAFKATAGATGATTATVTSTIQLYLTIALRPQPNDYPLTCNSGSFTLTGSSAGVYSNHSLTSNSGSFSVTGSSATITIAAAPVDYPITCNSGSFTYTGSNASISRNRALSSSSGSYTYTGSSAAILRNRSLSESQGSFVVTGSSSTITVGAAPNNYQITATAGAYTVSGISVSVLRSRLVEASSGSFLYTGSDATVLKARQFFLTANPGSFVLTGHSITVNKIYQYPPVEFVAAGVVYGPGGMYTGTMDAVDKTMKMDLTTGRLVKPLNNKTVMSL